MVSVCYGCLVPEDSEYSHLQPILSCARWLTKRDFSESIVRLILKSPPPINYRQTHAGDSSYPQDAPRQKRLLFRIRTVYPNVVELSASSLLKREDFQQFLWNVSDDTVLVVTDINLDAEYGKVWLRLVTDNRTILTFNLVDCGIVFFDKTKYKQNFNVNY